MKFRIVLISALLASGLVATMTGIAQADIIAIGGKPTIVRGAPARCDGNRPLIINVREALKRPNETVPKCEVQLHRKHRHKTHSITNIIIIADRHNRYYRQAH
jgi:hypothetical protein